MTALVLVLARGHETAPPGLASLRVLAGVLLQVHEVARVLNFVQQFEKISDLHQVHWAEALSHEAVLVRVEVLHGVISVQLMDLLNPVEIQSK